MKTLIVNADDFGYSKGVNLGIIEAFQNGVVRSTTIMPGADGFDHAIELAEENPGLAVGVHLTLTAGKCVGGPYKTITDENGNFLRLNELTERLDEVDLSEVCAEYEAQIMKVLDANIVPDHFDSHHHTHTMPGIFEVFKSVALKYGVGARVYSRNGLDGRYTSIKTPESFCDSFYGETATVEHLREVLRKNKLSSLEVMSHPAYVDYPLCTGSSYAVQRTSELHLLTSREVREMIAQQGYSLGSFSDLKQNVGYVSA